MAASEGFGLQVDCAAQSGCTEFSSNHRRALVRNWSSVVGGLATTAAGTKKLLHSIMHAWAR